MNRSLTRRSLLTAALLSLCAASAHVFAADAGNAKDLFAKDLSDALGGDHWKWENGELTAKDRKSTRLNSSHG